MKFLAYWVVFAVVLLFAACSTEVELNADYKSTTVIFGLLDVDSDGNLVRNALDTQWIKINKTFLGEGDNTAFAGIRDSSEYDDADFVKKVVQRYHADNFVEEYELFSKTVSNKQVNGIFYGPEQTLYYFTPPAAGLDSLSTYKLLLQFTDGREVSAVTNVVNYRQFNWIAPQITTTVSLASSTGGGVPNYSETSLIRWYAAENAVQYDALLRFHYTEYVYPTTERIPGTGVATEKSIDFRLGSKDAEDVLPGTQLTITFNGESFYSFLANSLEHSDKITRQIGHFDGTKTRCFDVILSMANEELKTYILVNTPSTGIIQERPVYTNVTNGGLGLFGARGTRKLNDLTLITYGGGGFPQTGNLEGFVYGVMQPLNFCDPNPGSDYTCPDL